MFAMEFFCLLGKTQSVFILSPKKFKHFIFVGKKTEIFASHYPGDTESNQSYCLSPISNAQNFYFGEGSTVIKSMNFKSFGKSSSRTYQPSDLPPQPKFA